ncbi:hypothetical protein M0804_013193 [Polistes exclamans]|nr:hypothetical protein M0804_013193 [Polistes exclamans]
MRRLSSARGDFERDLRKFEYVRKEFAQFQKALGEIDRTSPSDIVKLKIRISKIVKDVAILEEMIEKTSREAIGMLVDKIHNHVESFIDAKAETELIIIRAESVASQVANLPTASLLSQASTTFSSLSVDRLVAEKIRVLEITADNYQIAWKTLVECYENPVILINMNVRAILKGPPINSNPATRLQWEQQCSREALPTVEEFDVFLRDTGNALVSATPAEKPRRIDNGRRIALFGPESSFPDYKFAHVLRKAAAEKCKGSHCELLHVKEAVAEGATVGITSLRIQAVSEVHDAHVKLNHSRALALLRQWCIC